MNNCMAGCKPPVDTRPFLSLPYYGSDVILLAKYLRGVGFNVCFKTVSTLGSLLFKPSVTPNGNSSDNTNVVYVLNCNECNVCYIGETTRMFSIRLKEHGKDVTSQKPDNKLSAISFHARSTGYNFVFDKYIDRSSVYRDLLFKEDLFISCNENLCNIRSTDRNSVSPIWLCLRDLLRI